MLPSGVSGPHFSSSGSVGSSGSVSVSASVFSVSFRTSGFSSETSDSASASASSLEISGSVSASVSGSFDFGLLLHEPVLSLAFGFDQTYVPVEFCREAFCDLMLKTTFS